MSRFHFLPSNSIDKPFNFYHRQQQPQWGEHPIRLKQHPSKSRVFNGKAKPANCRCGWSSGHSRHPGPLLLAGTVELRNVGSRYRVWADICNVVPRSEEVVGGLQFTEEIDHGSGFVAINGNMMTRRPPQPAIFACMGGVKNLINSALVV